MERKTISANRSHPAYRLLAPLLAILLAGFSTAMSQTQPRFLVHPNVDKHDAVKGDGACLTAQGECSLRTAIEENESNPGNLMLNGTGRYVKMKGIERGTSELFGGILYLGFLGILE